MSWEEMPGKRIPCPCGKGFISQTKRGDDWNRIEFGTPFIECEHCADLYRIEAETHYRPLASDGSSTLYFLTPIDYPAYSGTLMQAVYPQPADVKAVGFSGYLIRNYPYEVLTSFVEQAEKYHAASKISGAAKKIVKDHHRHFQTEKLNVLLLKVQSALEAYHTTDDNFENRDRLKRKETEERRAYTEEKRKHQILLDL